MQAAASRALAAMDGIGGVVAELDAVATSVAAAVEEQSATTAKISRAITGAAENAADVANRMEALTQDLAIPERPLGPCSQAWMSWPMPSPPSRRVWGRRCAGTFQQPIGDEKRDPP
ncbi:MAG: hypothetical protein FJX33_10985 [Alphaproteobacteria bacterium]|nr:hypothetical protein [Alphaproteobacteria bacterium]